MNSRFRKNDEEWRVGYAPSFPPHKRKSRSLIPAMPGWTAGDGNNFEVTDEALALRTLSPCVP